MNELKLKVLKDCELSEPVTYQSNRWITFMTAETRAGKDKYIFSTTRTSDTSRALITCDYSTDGSASAITLTNGASMTLQTIRLNGQQRSRAIHVTSDDTSAGTLTVSTNARIENFSTTGSGGAILLDDGTNLTINGGYNRTAVFSANQAAEGGAIAVGKNCSISLTNAQFTGNKTNSGNGGALSIDERDEGASEIPLTNVVFRSNTAKNGGAVFTGENANLTIGNSTFTSNVASDSNGGAVTIGGNGTLTISGGTFTGNKAGNGNGGAIFVAKTAELTVTNGNIRSNSAEFGSAIYGDSAVDDENDGAKIYIDGGTITGNTASDNNGGAINVGGLNAQIFFTGSPYVFGNTGNMGTAQQKNVVLSRDSNEIIWTTEAGLTGGTIGVYVIDGSDLFGKHGQATNPFGTFGDTERANPSVFRNDRNAELYGVAKADDPTDLTIYWSGVAGSRRVILRKVVDEGGRFQPVNDAQFGVFTDEAGEHAAEGIVRTDDGKEETVKLDNLTSGASGILWIGDLPYGTYYLKESSPEKVFVLTVNEDGVGYQTVDQMDPSKAAYSNELRAN